MSTAPTGEVPPPKAEYTLTQLLAAPVALSAALLAAWYAGGYWRLGRAATAALVLDALLPLMLTWSVVSLLRQPSPRALVAPTPMMMWLTFTAERNTKAAWYWELIAHVTLLVLLDACWRGNRKIAQFAALACGGVAVWLKWSGALAS